MGCAKNTVDSEHLIGLLTAAGHTIVDDVKKAQAAVINTCGFIQNAVKENVDAILDLELIKEQGELEKLVVTGCLVNRCEEELRKELPSVDLWARAEDWDSILAFLGKETAPELVPTGCLPRGRLAENTPWSRYLKVSEGCDSRCSYCTIPMIRGPLRSIPIPQLRQEALELAASGAREICLVGQDLTTYGLDLYGKPSLNKLLKALNRDLPARRWVRLLYLHPDRITLEFLDFLFTVRRIVPYLDIPIQHVDDDILSAMNRRPVALHIRNIVRHLRAKFPLFALRTTLMVGFPGETDEQFEKLVDFLEEVQLDRVGVFVYSPEEGTQAALMPNQVPEAVKEARYARLMTVQANISRERNLLFLGRVMKVLVEEVDGKGLAWGRTYRDAPEVDGMVCVEAVGKPKRKGPKRRGYELPFVLGSFVSAIIHNVNEYDLFGKNKLKYKKQGRKGKKA
jgi:ribosomal protein S12 methylthiotransferase